MEIKQFTDDALKHVFEICTSTMNILELLGYEPYKIRGQKCKEILNIYANQIGVNIEDYKSNNIKFRKYNELHPVCKTCGHMFKISKNRNFVVHHVQQLIIINIGYYQKIYLKNFHRNKTQKNYSPENEIMY